MGHSSRLWVSMDGSGEAELGKYHLAHELDVRSPALLPTAICLPPTSQQNTRSL